MARPDNVPDAEIPHNPRYLTAPNYGLKTWADLFTNRQLTALVTFTDLVTEIRARISEDGGEPAYANAIGTYLALGLSRIADYHNSLCIWLDQPKNEGIGHLFSRQAIPMIFDFCEGNPFSDSSGNLADMRNWVADALSSTPASVAGFASQADAATSSFSNRLVSTDPPYYDNVGYSDLADFFYVWLRRSVGDVYPELLGTVLTPKADELVADPFRQENANKFFEDGYAKVFSRISLDTAADFPITVFYAFKQAETDDDGGHASTGWETLLEGMLKAGWTVTGTWPVRSERGSRMRAIGSNALASSIVLACRPRPANAGFTDRRGLINALREGFPNALRKIEQGKVAPVDLRQAAIGPGMAVFSRCK